MRPSLRTKREKSRLIEEGPEAVEEAEGEVGVEEASGVAEGAGEEEDSRPVLLDSDGCGSTKPRQSCGRRAVVG